MIDISIIQNKNELTTSEQRRKALEILEGGIRSVLPDMIMRSAVSFARPTGILTINNHIYQLEGRLFVVGGGKASGLMSQTLENITGPDIIEGGIVIDKANPSDFRTRKIKILQAGHPFPDERGIKAVREIFNLKSGFSIGEKDIVLCLISGGGSALMPYPAEGISLADKQEITRLLLACGADIHEINAVRKHISAIKGGRLAYHFAPARVISLILSDVIGNDLSVIASGPTYPDPTTFADAYEVIKKYAIQDKVPESILSTLERGCRGEEAETPKSLNNADNYIIGDNRTALEAMAEKARKLGLKPVIVSSELTGDTVTAARKIAIMVMEGKFAGYNALLIGGETTPALPDKPGKGGRNQHYAAVTPLFLENYSHDWVLASVGTDGSDFMPDIAGAITDQRSLKVFRHHVQGYQKMLQNYDSYTVLKTAGNSLIITGNTHTNVGDIMAYLI